VRIREGHPFPGHLIHMCGIDPGFFIQARQVPVAHVVRENENDVGSVGVCHGPARIGRREGNWRARSVSGVWVVDSVPQKHFAHPTECQVEAIEASRDRRMLPSLSHEFFRELLYSFMERLPGIPQDHQESLPRLLEVDFISIDPKLLREANRLASTVHEHFGGLHV